MSNKRFKYFLESLRTNDNEILIQTVMEAYQSIFESRRGVARTLDSISERFSLPSKDWPQNVKEELYRAIEHTITPKQFSEELLDPEGLKELLAQRERFKDTDTWKNLKMLNVDYSEPTVLELSISDLSDTSSEYAPTPTKKAILDRLPAIIRKTGPEIKGVPLDTERHQAQARLLKEQGGINREPVIMIKEPNGKYALQEGWHRTLQVIASNIETEIQKNMLEKWSSDEIANAPEENLSIMRDYGLRMVNLDDFKFKINANVGTPKEPESLLKRLLSIFKR